VRPRWERIATAQRRGQAMPPIDVYRIGELHDAIIQRLRAELR